MKSHLLIRTVHVHVSNAAAAVTPRLHSVEHVGCQQKEPGQAVSVELHQLQWRG